MARERNWRWAAVFAAMLLLVSGLVAATTRNEEPPEPTPPAALAPAPVTVTLTSFEIGGRASLGATLPFRIEAKGAGVDSLSLWENDVQVAEIQLPDTERRGDTTARSVDWVALQPGERVLHASAHGSAGVGHSAPVRIIVSANAATPDRLVVDAPPGTTAAEFAARHGLDADLVRTEPPGTTTGTKGADGRAHFGISTDELLDAARKPLSEQQSDTSGPRLEASREGCTVEIHVVGIDGDATVYHATGASVGFTAVGSVHGDGSLDIGPLGPGSHVFVTGPKGGPTTTAPVALTLPDSCLSNIWHGDASLVDGILTIPEPDSGLLSMYLSTDENPATRAPRSAYRWFRSSRRHIDVTRFLPVLSGSRIHLEVWSYDAEDRTAAVIATGDADLQGGLTPVDLIGESSGVELEITPRRTRTVDRDIVGTWSAHSPRVDRVVWQVTSQPIQIDNTSLQPLGLIATGVSTTADNGEGDRPGGTFRIPLAELKPTVRAPVSIAPLTRLEIQSAAPTTHLPDFVDPLIDDKMAIDPSVIADVMDSDEDVTPGAVENQPVFSSSTFFIRVVPMAGASPLGEASGSVRFEGPSPTDRPQVSLDSGAIDFDAGRAANPALSGCVRVTAVPWAGRSSNPIDAAFFPHVGTYCPGDWPAADDSVDCGIVQVFCDAGIAVVEGVIWLYDQATELWDALASIYNEVVDFIVMVAAKLNPACLMASAVAYGAGEIGFSDTVTDVTSAAADLCDQVAQAASKAVVSGVLASFGLPPELPTSEQLEAIAKGDLVEIAVSYLESIGVPCDELVLDAADATLAAQGIEAVGGDVPSGTADGVDVCRDLVRSVSGELAKKLKAAVQTQIANATGLPLPGRPIDGFEFTMEPRGVYRAPRLMIGATPRTPHPPADAYCRVSAWADTEIIGKPTWEPWTFGARTFDLTQTFGEGFVSETSFAFNPAAQVTVGGLESGTLVSVTLRSECLDRGGEQKLFDRVGEPEGRWRPGRG